MVFLFEHVVILRILFVLFGSFEGILRLFFESYCWYVLLLRVFQHLFFWFACTSVCICWNLRPSQGIIAWTIGFLSIEVQVMIQAEYQTL